MAQVYVNINALLYIRRSEYKDVGHTVFVQKAARKKMPGANYNEEMRFYERRWNSTHAGNTSSWYDHRIVCQGYLNVHRRLNVKEGRNKTRNYASSHYYLPRYCSCNQVKKLCFRPCEMQGKVTLPPLFKRQMRARRKRFGEIRERRHTICYVFVSVCARPNWCFRCCCCVLSWGCLHKVIKWGKWK